ncbi:DUF5068 domain-containing protein [Terribacillus saccharophilus]|uniref:DUF5068 domain-containing protein n=1 Tax=Terribacillus saccharophilus TaxID=361277 RepID=UPI003982CB4E
MLTGKWMFLLGAVLAMVIIGGCSGDNQETNADKDENTAEQSGPADHVNDTEAETAANSKEIAEFPEVIEYMRTEIEATDARVLYENNEPQAYEMEGVTASLDAYSLIEMKDFDANHSYSFDDETSGAILLGKFTVTNDTDSKVYYMPSFAITYSSEQGYKGDYLHIVPKNQQLLMKLPPDDNYTLEAGESVTGYMAYPFGTSALETIMDEGSAFITVPVALTAPDDYDSAIGKEGKFTVNFDAASAEKSKADQAFYQDLASHDNMGEKKMIEQKEDIAQSKELADATITLDGYQFTEFTPNEFEAPLFRNFLTGVVLLTVQFTVDNKSSADIGLENSESTLYVNDGAQSLINEARLSPYEFQETVASGDTAELLHVYVLDKEQYENIWKDKAFEIELGPLYDENAEELSEGNKVTFKIK